MAESLDFAYFDHPGFYTHDNQWATDGWLFKDGEVIAFSEDRKEQYGTINGRQTPEAFLASDAPPKAKAWLRALLA